MMISSFCGCATIRTGAIVVGCIHAVFSLLMAIFLVFFTSLYIVSLVLSVQLIFSILMIVGAKNKNLNYVFPFVCIYCTNAVTLIPILITVNVELGRAHNVTVWNFILGNSNMGICIGLHIYFFMVIYTFYQELLREKYPAPIITYQKECDEMQQV